MLALNCAIEGALMKAKAFCLIIASLLNWYLELGKICPLNVSMMYLNDITSLAANVAAMFRVAGDL